MKTLRHIHIAFVLAGTVVSAQPSITWQKCLGGSADEQTRCIQRTMDGGYITAGSSSSADGDVGGNHGGFDVWAAKLDSSGAIEWETNVGGTMNDLGLHVIQAQDSGYVIAGSTASNDGDVSGNQGDQDMWVVKLDADGDLLWQKCLGGSGSETAFCIRQTVDEGYIVAGITTSNDGEVSGNNGDQDIWVVKLDAIGDLQWQKCLGSPAVDVAFTIEETDQGGYIVAGRVGSNGGDVSGLHGDWDMWLVDLNGSGAIQWQRCYGGSGFDGGLDVRQTSDHGFIAAGLTYSVDGDVTDPIGNGDFWVVKCDSIGNLGWERCIGGTAEDVACSVRPIDGGGYIVVGRTLSNDLDASDNHGGRDLLAVELDASGNQVWQKCLGGSDEDWGWAVDTTADGGYILAGYTSSDDQEVSNNHGGQDIWVVKLGGDMTVSYPENVIPLITTYPNPSNGDFLLMPDARDTDPITVRITDAVGRSVLGPLVLNGQGPTAIHLSDVRSGLYLLRATRRAEEQLFKVVVRE
ncbi:MAG: T9SS type A sorting domain-containing protein [Flavobacteriales bacterium]|nr:T9SS type A sorting domain-containing protein [Flavobacteriales bacterium]